MGAERWAPARGEGGPAVVRVAVVGVTGYAGIEALRLLQGHPGAEVALLASHGHAGERLDTLYGHLGALGRRVLEAVDPATIAARSDVALLSLPARASLELAPQLLERGVRVIDFGADFRLRDADTYARFYGGAHSAPGWLREAVYGLPEFHRAEIAGAALVANPGCYPTAALLALWPALRAGAVSPEDILIDAKSGVTGAGRGLALSAHFAEADGNLWPYKLAGEHRHTPEMRQELALAAGRPVTLSFSPHQVPMSRGLLATCYARLAPGWTGERLAGCYRQAYAEEPFVQWLDHGLPATKATVGTNVGQVALRVDPEVGRAVLTAAIDNLGKGAAGQAIQNLNRMFGLDEGSGLPGIGVFP